MRRLKWIIIAIVLLILASATTLKIMTFQRQYQDVFAELIIYTGTVRTTNIQVCRFVLRDNGMLVGYRGLIPHNYDVTRGRALRWVQERVVITLGEEDFYGISELVRLSVKDYYTYGDSDFRSQWMFTLLYQRNVYRVINFALRNEIIRLSPLEIR